MGFIIKTKSEVVEYNKDQNQNEDQAITRQHLVPRTNPYVSRCDQRIVHINRHGEVVSSEEKCTQNSSDEARAHAESMFGESGVLSQNKSNTIEGSQQHDNSHVSNRMSTTIDNRRSESRASNFSDFPSQHADAVHSTLAVLKEDVEKTTEVLRRKHQEQLNEQHMFNSNMEVNGRISMIADDDWLSTRLKSISKDDMRRELDKVKSNQHRNVVGDTLAALVYDVEATTEVLRRAGQKKAKKTRVISEEVEYRLKLDPAPEEDESYDPRKSEVYQGPDDNLTLETMKRDYGVEITEDSVDSLRRRRARSQTPRRTLNIESSPPPLAIPRCNYCCQEIDGPILTALAPNADKAQKFHQHCFLCIYCQKSLSTRGVYREHQKQPYCHECFYKLYNGLQYCPDNNQAAIEKLI